MDDIVKIITDMIYKNKESQSTVNATQQQFNQEMVKEIQDIKSYMKTKPDLIMSNVKDHVGEVLGIFKKEQCNSVIRFTEEEFRTKVEDITKRILKDVDHEEDEHKKKFFYKIKDWGAFIMLLIALITIYFPKLIQLISAIIKAMSGS